MSGIGNFSSVSSSLSDPNNASVRETQASKGVGELGSLQVAVSSSQRQYLEKKLLEIGKPLTSKYLQIIMTFLKYGIPPSKEAFDMIEGGA